MVIRFFRHSNAFTVENKAENRTEQLDDCLTELHAP